MQSLTLGRQSRSDSARGAQVLVSKIGALRLKKVCLFVLVVVCCCGCYGVTRHMKQRSRADRLRGVRTLAVRHRFRIVSLGSRQRCGAFTVCFPSWNDILFVCARTPAELVGAWQPSFQNQVFLRFVFVLDWRASRVLPDGFLALALSCLSHGASKSRTAHRTDRTWSHRSMLVPSRASA